MTFINYEWLVYCNILNISLTINLQQKVINLVFKQNTNVIYMGLDIDTHRKLMKIFFNNKDSFTIEEQRFLMEDFQKNFVKSILYKDE